MYKGTQFRSRLEARWACFFDKLGWKWEYEPFDLTGWIPDFALYSHHGKNKGKLSVLVEVRPYSTENEWKEKAFEITSMAGDFYKAAGQVAPTILCCGSTIWQDYDYTYDVIGYMQAFMGDGFWLIPAVLKNDGDVFDFCGGELAAYDGELTDIDRDRFSYSICEKDYELMNLWRSSGNEVQWKKQR